MQEEYSLKGHIHSTESFGTVDGPEFVLSYFFRDVPCGACTAIIRIPGRQTGEQR